MLILSLGHWPMPQADFHSIRHHDGPGEVCELHEHLLRWHPHAGPLTDVAVLHWHWLPPSADWGDRDSESGKSALLAPPADWLAVDLGGGPALVPEPRLTLLGRPPLTLAGLVAPLALPGERLPIRAGPWPAEFPTPCLPAGHSLTALLQRWTC